MGGIDKLPEIQKQETRPEDEDEKSPVITREDFKDILENLGSDEKGDTGESY